MKLRDMTELAVRNLREAILRNSLTTLGVSSVSTATRAATWCFCM